VEKLSSGKYRGAWRNPSGKKCYTRRPEFPEHPYTYKADARDAAQEAEVRANRTAAVEAGTLSAKLPWGDWWDLLAPKRSRRASDTYLKEKHLVERYIRPRWGDTDLNRITNKQVQKWVNRLTDGDADEWTNQNPPQPSYVRRIFAVLRTTMQLAVNEEIIDANPCAGVKLPPIRRKRKSYTTVEDAAAIGAKLRADYQDANDFILETGLRPNEVCGLHADRIDRAARVVEVDMVYVSRKRVIRSWPKDKDARVVPLTQKALDILDRRIGDRDLTAGCGVPHADGSVCDSMLVFLTDAGRPMNVQQMGNRMRYAATAHGVPRRTPYSARRGFSTRAARGGMDAFAIAAVMGHADVNETQGYVQDEGLGPLLRAALGEREPLAVIDGGREEVRGGDARETG
jgi:integrase